MRPAIAAALLLVITPCAHAQSWSFGISGFVFDPPEDSGYFSPIAYADRARLHVEARYNYEDLETVSAFVGWNLSAGGDVALALTPIVGVLIGETDGVAPGFEAEVTWREFALYVESEYVFDVDASDDSFLYSWIETTYAAAAWLRAGIVAQKTETYQTGLEMQRGLMAEVSRDAWSLGAYWFNPDRSQDDLFVFSAGYVF